MNTPGEFKDHTFLTSRVKWNINHMFGILTSRAIDWHINELTLRGRLEGGHLGGLGKFGVGLQNFAGQLPANYKYIFEIHSSIPADWHPCRVIGLRGGGGLGAWSQKCMECPLVGRGGVFRQNASNWFQTCSSQIVLYRSCMIEVKKCFGKSFGWICALNRWLVQERAHNSFYPITLQVLNYLAWELCRQIAAPTLRRVTP